MPKPTLNERSASLLRDYLKSIPLRSKNRKIETVEAVSREWSQPMGVLKRFRDGDNRALPAPIVNAWAKMLGGDGIISAGQSPVDQDWYLKMIEEPETQYRRMEIYEEIIRTRPEARSAAEAWADIAITGSSSGMDTSGNAFDAEYSGTDKFIHDVVVECNNVINRHLLPNEQKLMLARDMAIYGKQFEQIVLRRDADGLDIERLVNMPVKSMHFNRQDNGTFDPQKAYYQQFPHETEPSAYFPIWKIAGFVNRFSRSTPEGESFLASSLRTYIEVEAMEQSLIVRRIERAALKYKRTLDGGLCQTQDELEAMLERAKIRDRKISTITRDGKHGMMRISTPPDMDLYVVKKDKESPADISTLEGDGNIGQLADFEHFWGKWMSGLGPPKTHLGYEAGVQRAVVSEQHIVWARRGRRFQMHFVAGMRHLFWLRMLLRGVDPREAPITIWPPSMGTKDELLRAQVMQLQSQTVKNLSESMSKTGKQPSIEWMLQYIMMLPQDAIDDLELAPALQIKSTGGQPSTGSGSGTPRGREAMELAAHALQDPEVQMQARVVEMLIQERALKMRKRDWMGAVDRAMIDSYSQPFDGSFRDVVETFGIQKLICERRVKL